MCCYAIIDRSVQCDIQSFGLHGRININLASETGSLLDSYQLIFVICEFFNSIVKKHFKSVAGITWQTGSRKRCLWHVV